MDGCGLTPRTFRTDVLPFCKLTSFLVSWRQILLITAPTQGISLSLFSSLVFGLSLFIAPRIGRSCNERDGPRWDRVFERFEDRVGHPVKRFRGLGRDNMQSNADRSSAQPPAAEAGRGCGRGAHINKPAWIRLPFDECKNIDHVLKLVMEHIGNLPTNCVAGAWSFIFRLLSKEQRNWRDLRGIGTDDAQRSQQRQQQLRYFFQHTMSLLDEMRSIDLTTIIFSMAKIVNSIREAHDRKRMSTYHQALQSVLKDLSPFGDFAKAADRILMTFEARQLSNLAYAYALVGYNPKFEDGSSLLQKIGDRSKSCINQFDPQGLANTVWAFAKTDVQHAALFEAVGDHITRLDDLTTFKPQELSNIVWAYATLDAQHQAVFDKVGDHIVRLDDLAAFKPQELANIVWAYAKVNAKQPALFKQIGDSVVCFDSSKPFIPQNLANIVWAYAKVGVQHPDLFKMIGHSIAAVNDLAIFDTRHLTNISWAFAMANIDAPWLFNDRFTNELLRRQHQFNDAELRQLYQWHVWQTKNKLNVGLASPLKEKCINAYNGGKMSS